MEREDLAARLAGPCGVFEVELPSSAAEALAAYVALLLEWAPRINLTGARTAEQIVDDHLADAVAVAGAIPPGARSLVDVGSGAGLPGVVVSILIPGLECTLLEPRAKRWAFLREVRRSLGLEHLIPVQERLETHVSSKDFSPYAVAVSRATWPPDEWLARAIPLVEPGGRVIALEGATESALPPAAVRKPYQLARGAGAVVVLDL